jgi:hypothetical protein
MAQLHDDGRPSPKEDAAMKFLHCACGQVLSAETGAGLLEAVEAHLAEVLATNDQRVRHACSTDENLDEKGGTDAG